MKKSLFTFFVFLSVMIGCSDEETGGHRGNDGNGFSLSYTVSTPTSVLTRSAVDLEEDEDQINSFYVLFFENTSGKTGRFLEAIDVMESYTGSVASSGYINITFPEGSPLSNTQEYKMLVCANIHNHITPGNYTCIQDIEDLRTFCDGKTEQQVTYLLQTIKGVEPNEDEEADNDGQIPSDNLPMSISLVKPANATQVTVELDRTVARFDVFCEASDYELVSASIWNAYTESDVWEGNFSDFSAPRTERYYGVKADSNKEIKGSLYAFENYVSEPVQNDKVTTCLIIGLRKTGSQDVEYFRTNVNASGSLGQQLKRNTAYRTIVKDVLNKGSETERGAYENEKLLLDIDVEGWKVDESGTIQVEGKNVLVIPTAIARLFAQGETREYYVYTIGEGVPAITGEHLPDNIKATLKLAPGYSENSDFKKSILTFTAAPGKTLNDDYKIEIGFSTMSAPIKVEQVEGNIDFIELKPYKEIELEARQGSVTEEIKVNSSGAWVAEIVQGDYLSFSSSTTTQQTTFEGTPGEGFSLYAFQHNVPDETRYWFVSVYLKDKPEIVRNLVIAQKGGADTRYVRFTTNQINMSRTATYVSVSIQSDSEWEAEIFIEKGTKAGFDSKHIEQTKEGQKNQSVYVYAPLYYGNTPSRIIVKATIKGTDFSDELLITQPAYYTGTMFVTNASGAGNLSATGVTYYNYYVYSLGQKMRDKTLFGSEGTEVDMPGGGFHFISANTTAGIVEEARIVQIVNNTPSLVGTVYEYMEKDPSKLLMITGTTTTITNGLLNAFNAKTDAGYGSTTSPVIPAATERTFYSGEKSGHPLLQYLLNGVVNPEEIVLKSYGTANVGLAEDAWAPTFVPIIMSGGKCVFGIDPVHRLILMTDPGIFGSNTSSSSYPNYSNFRDSGSDNSKFLNNFVAWMARVATEGESFLQQFQ